MAARSLICFVFCMVNVTVNPVYFPLYQTNRDSLRVGLMRELEQSEHRLLASPSRQGVGLEVHEKTRHQQLAYSRGAGREHSSAGTGRAPPGLRRPCG